jgi:dTDP-4-amino-4,6-dideoxygalactose transaminase
MKIVDSLADVRKSDAVIELVKDVMYSGVYSEGEQTAEFEMAVSALYDNKPVVAFSNCGAGLFTVFRWLKRKGHQKVVVANNTFFATASMAAEAGLTPVLCDNGPVDPSMSVDSMISAVQMSGANVVCLTHVGGWIAKDYEAIAEYCRTNKLYLVEDAAHAFGVFNEQGHGAGSLGDCAVFSFYPTKAVPGGEGGALVISERSSQLLDFALRFRSYGKEKDPDGTIRYDQGFNLRMSEFDAAVLRVQVWYTPEIMANRLSQATILHEAGFKCLMGDPTVHSNYYKYPVASVDKDPRRQVGKIYSLTDQLFTSLRRYHVEGPVILKNSKLWAQTHICIPLGEHTYVGLKPKAIHEWISQQ